MAGPLEAIMLLRFGIPWPLDAHKTYEAGTAAGASWQFIALITASCFAGIAAPNGGHPIKAIHGVRWPVPYRRPWHTSYS